MLTPRGECTRPRDFLDDLSQQIRNLGFCGRRNDDFYKAVEHALQYLGELLVIDQAHLRVRHRDMLRKLIDVFSATGAPQLWIGTGDLHRYLNRKDVAYDPMEQIWSRIDGNLDLSELLADRQALLTRGQIREIANRILASSVSRRLRQAMPQVGLPATPQHASASPPALPDVARSEVG